MLGLLRSWCAFEPQWLIADIGAGTGMAAEIFLANGNPVIAVESNVDMLSMMTAAYASTHQHAGQLRIMEATGEQTTLASGSVDMIVVGRAFHWFEKERALAEFKRIFETSGMGNICDGRPRHQRSDLR